MPFGNSDCWSNCRAAFGWTKNAQRRWHSTRECIETRTIQDAVDMEGCLDFPGARLRQHDPWLVWRDKDFKDIGS